MSGFRTSADIVGLERAHRMAGNRMRFGISYLDDSLYGIMPDDLILIGAPSGVGKTDLGVNIALANLEDGKTVHFFALEAGEFEIERRIKWRQICNSYYGDPDRPRIGRKMEYDEWLAGDLDEQLLQYDDWATKWCATGLSQLKTYYKSGSDFDVNRLTDSIYSVSNTTDLLIIDHAHYFDFDDDNENRALKLIAKTLRSIALELRKPIILVAHLRKRGSYSKELVAGLDEFHGSSDLVKIATKVVTLAPGKNDGMGKYVTFMRTPKNRNNGSSKVYSARLTYDVHTGGYDHEYKIGWASAEEFEEIDLLQQPNWLFRTSKRGTGRDCSNYAPRGTLAPDSAGQAVRHPYSD